MSAQRGPGRPVGHGHGGKKEKAKNFGARQHVF